MLFHPNYQLVSLNHIFLIWHGIYQNWNDNLIPRVLDWTLIRLWVLIALNYCDVK